MARRADLELKFMKTLRQLNYELRQLQETQFDKRVLALRDSILSERKPQIEEIQRQIDALRGAKATAKPRWPEQCPQVVIDACAAYWFGTTEAKSFRIHRWDAHRAITSYAGGSYTSGQERKYGQSQYVCISLTHKERDKPKEVAKNYGRTSDARMYEMLNTECE